MNIETVSGTQATSELSGQLTFLPQTVGASEHHARTSQLQEEGQDWMENGVPSFERYFDFLKKRGKKIDLNGCFMKMLRACYQATEDLTSLPFSLRWIGGGYDIEWQLLNSKYHGVPQNRERVYTVGHLRNKGVRKIFPIKRTVGEDCLEVEQVAQLYGTEREPNPQAGRVYDPNGISPTMDTCSGGNRMPKIGIKIVANYPSGNQKSAIFDPGGVSRTLTGTDYKQPVSVVLKLPEILTHPGEE